ncbi:MAG TPA: hypothetical protein VES60_04415 [Nakamurella sp.]|nr:hypothetical protein [Nakamurella sp.]
MLAAIDNAVVLAGVVLNRSGPVIGVSSLFTSLPVAPRTLI